MALQRFLFRKTVLLGAETLFVFGLIKGYFVLDIFVRRFVLLFDLFPKADVGRECTMTPKNQICAAMLRSLLSLQEDTLKRVSALHERDPSCPHVKAFLDSTRASIVRIRCQLINLQTENIPNPQQRP